jgi:hypothetical protein
MHPTSRLAKSYVCTGCERDPESVDVTNDELTHAIEGIIKVFHDLNAVHKASVQVINVIGGYVLVELATVINARSPANLSIGIFIVTRLRRQHLLVGGSTYHEEVSAGPKYGGLCLD